MKRSIAASLLITFSLLGFWNGHNTLAGVRDETEPTFDIHQPRPVRIYEAFPFSALTKQWSASNGVKAYFDAQKRIFSEMEKIEAPVADAQFSMAAIGDLMRMPSVQKNSVHPNTQQFLSQFDVITGNLETLISPRYPLPPDSLFMMNSTAEIVEGFRDKQGNNLLSLVSLANNHIVDYPDDAIEDTIALLEKENIAHHGIFRPGETQTFTQLNKDGIHIAYYAATTFVNSEKKLADSQNHLTPMLAGIRPVIFSPWQSFEEIDLTPFKKVLSEMEASGADFKVISLHWGWEHVMYPEPVQIEIAHALVSAGADLVIGAHTHVPQPAEICFVNGYEKRLAQPLAEAVEAQGCRLTASGPPRKGMIFYSLGNFRGYSASFWQQLGTIAKLHVYRHKNRTDWEFRGFSFTQDVQENPPNGPRHLMLLEDYIADHCKMQTCPDIQTALADQARRHMQGESLNSIEEIWVAGLSLFDSLNRLFAIIWRKIGDETE